MAAKIERGDWVQATTVIEEDDAPEPGWMSATHAEHRSRGRWARLSVAGAAGRLMTSEPLGDATIPAGLAGRADPAAALCHRAAAHFGR
jgi:hypothetical protein